MSHRVAGNGNLSPGDRTRESPRRRGRGGAEFLTPGEFLHRLGWLLVVVLAVAVAANGFALLAGR